MYLLLFAISRGCLLKPHSITRRQTVKRSVQYNIGKVKIKYLAPLWETLRSFDKILSSITLWLKFNENQCWFQKIGLYGKVLQLTKDYTVLACWTRLLFMWYYSFVCCLCRCQQWVGNIGTDTEARPSHFFPFRTKFASVSRIFWLQESSFDSLCSVCKLMVMYLFYFSLNRLFTLWWRKRYATI